MIAGSVSAFTFSLMRARLPSAAAEPTVRICSTRRVAEVVGRDEQLAELLRPGEAGQVVEEVGDVRGDVLVGGEDADVLVEPRRQRVVVARCRCARSGAGRSPSRRTTRVVFAWIFRFGKP